MTTSSEWLAAFGLRVSPFFKEIDDADLLRPQPPERREWSQQRPRFLDALRALNSHHAEDDRPQPDEHRDRTDDVYEERNSVRHKPPEA